MCRERLVRTMYQIHTALRPHDGALFILCAVMLLSALLCPVYDVVVAAATSTLLIDSLGDTLTDSSGVVQSPL